MNNPRSLKSWLGVAVLVVLTVCVSSCRMVDPKVVDPREIAMDLNQSFSMRFDLELSKNNCPQVFVICKEESREIVFYVSSEGMSVPKDADATKKILFDSMAEYVSHIGTIGADGELQVALDISYEDRVMIALYLISSQLYEGMWLENFEYQTTTISADLMSIVFDGGDVSKIDFNRVKSCGAGGFDVVVRVRADE